MICLTLKMKALKFFALSGTIHPTQGELVAPCQYYNTGTLSLLDECYSCVPKMIHIGWNPIK